jgi:DNA repair protein RadD
MWIKLRPYQEEAIQSAREWFSKRREPCILNCAVGSGKSLMMAAIADMTAKKNGTALMIAPTMELVEQNAIEYYKYTRRTDFGIVCSSLGKKQLHKRVTFASPGSIVNNKIQNPSVIVVDEAHQGDFMNEKSIMSRIIRQYPNSLVIGFSGSPYRGKHLCYGEEMFFKECVYDLDMHKLISMGYLSKFRYGLDHSHDLNFDNCKVRGGKFRDSELSEAVDSQKRLTAEIIENVVNIVDSQERKGCFIFGSTVKHCKEIMQSLPPEKTGLILGGTPKSERKRLISQAKVGKILYLVSKDCLTTGVNIPHFDTIAFLRPTESRVIFVQCIGRALRLSEGKTNALILDYAGNKDRHSDEFVARKKIDGAEEEVLYELDCVECGWVNRNTARKCENCDYLILFKECHECEAKNDITARHCKSCDAELIDPNDKLTAEASVDDTIETADVKEIRVEKHLKGDKTMIKIGYLLDLPGIDRFFGKWVWEYHLTTEKYWSIKLWNRVIDDLVGSRFDNMYSVDECINRSNDFKCPKQLKYKINGKYIDVLERLTD